MPAGAAARLRRRLPGALAAAVAALAVLVLAAPARAEVRLQKVGDFDGPVYVTHAPGDHSRLYVVERAGTIRVVRNGVELGPAFADLRGLTEASGERGLLSIAFSPDFGRTGLSYAYYTDAQGDIRVDELRADGAERTDPSYRRTTIEIPHSAAPNHNGGTAAFGPDGMLYLATGDGGHGQSQNAQNTGSLLGKMLRIDPVPGGGYRVPAGNPFGNAVWSYGLRNPFRFSIDRATGDIVIGDVGASSTEEIDFAPASGSRGRGWNYGWSPCEGSYAQGSTTEPCQLPGAVGPVLDRFQPDWTTINAGVVVRDPSLPSLFGRFVYGDTGGGQLHSAHLRQPRVTDDRRLPFSLAGVAGFGEDAAGCVYVASLAGGVYRFVETSTQVPCPPQGFAGNRDRSAPRMRWRIPRSQRVRKRRGVIAYARCNERCTVAMSGRLRIGKRFYKLRKAHKPAGANQRITIRARLTRRAARGLRGALRRGRRASVRVGLRARDTAGNPGRLVRRTVRVRR